MRKIFRGIKYPLLITAVVTTLAACFAAGAGGVVLEVSGITLSEGTISPAFDPETTEYTATVAHTVNSVTVSVTTDNTDLTVTINETEVIPGDGSATINLVEGENTVTVVVSDGEDSVTYTVTATKEAPPEIVVEGPTSPSSGDANIISGTGINFGLVNSPGNFQQLTYTINNTGAGPLILTNAGPNFITISGTDADDFSVPQQPSEATIPPGGSMVFVLRFTAVSPNGNKTATATINTNDENEAVFILSLQGEAGCV